MLCDLVVKDPSHACHPLPTIIPDNDSLVGVLQDICRLFALPFQLCGLRSVKDVRSYNVVAVDSLGKGILAYAILWYVRGLADKVSKQTVHHSIRLVGTT
jgi:hypothetical protein